MNPVTIKGRECPLVILIPVFNDWEALELLLGELGRIAGRIGLPVNLVIVNDGSTALFDRTALLERAAGLPGMRMVELRRNVGHQRAIALGLAYAHDNFPGSLTLVMDGDGEDDPEDIPRLLEACRREGGQKIIFARRVKRMEGIFFRVFYQLYRFLHLLLTGLPVNVGNFSVVPYVCLERLVVVSEMWNHYAAAALKAKVPSDSIPTVRAPRLAGQPKMNFVALVLHGLSAISIFGAIAGVRFLIAISALTIVIFTVLLAVGIGGGFCGSVGRNWAVYLCGIFGLICIQAIMIISNFVLIILARRDNSAFLPLRDYQHFISAVEILAPASE